MLFRSTAAKDSLRRSFAPRLSPVISLHHHLGTLPPTSASRRLLSLVPLLMPTPLPQPPRIASSDSPPLPHLAPRVPTLADCPLLSSSHPFSLRPPRHLSLRLRRLRRRFPAPLPTHSSLPSPRSYTTSLPLSPLTLLYSSPSALPDQPRQSRRPCPRSPRGVRRGAWGGDRRFERQAFVSVEGV